MVKPDRLLDATDFARNSALYNVESREFAAGDRIVCLKNDKQLEVNNGQGGEIKEIKEDGTARITLDGGKEVEINLNSYQNIDHGYAVTVEKSQGATVENAIVVEPNSYNSFNVGITRAEFSADVITADLEKTAENIQNVEDKTSTLDFQQESSKEAADSIDQKISGLFDSLGRLNENEKSMDSPEKQEEEKEAVKDDDGGKDIDMD